jgi:Kef-type K+ transport system membrane component KefB
MILLSIYDITLPLTQPVLKFLVILIIILLAPILLNKIKIPPILGLIIAGAVIGPKGINLLTRDSSIILSGTAGLLYIMFLAGLEINLAEFKKNLLKSLGFGMYTFLIPMILGTVAGIYVLHFSVLTSVLLASMFASHTLIAYPILSKLDVTKNRAVNVAVGGTMITDTLSLLVLAVIVGMSAGEVNAGFWIKLSISISIFALTVVFIFPIIARWFLKRFNDNILQYIFVMIMLFTGATLAELAGSEAIIGAFLAGLALNRLIPSTSPLMNRIEFVGNAIFIPFFLIGVGMLVDYRAFFSDFETIKVAIVMSVVATFSKFVAAWLTQKTFRYTVDERRLIFGLSNAQAAVTLAAVMVGYNIIVGETASGEPIRLLGESILNGTIVMIFVTCTIATLVAQKGALNVSVLESTVTDKKEIDIFEKILIPVSNPETTEELIHLSTIIKSKENKTGLFALNIINNNSSDANAVKNAHKLMDKAIHTASSTDVYLNKLVRFDLNITNGITGIIREHNITDLVLGLHVKTGITESFLGNLTEGILTKNNTTTFVYKPAQPISTIKRQIIIIPKNAETEIGFPFWLLKIWNIGRNTGAKLQFYGHENTIHLIREINAKHPIEAEFDIFENWDKFLDLLKDIRLDDGLIIVMSRERKISYQSNMKNIPYYLNKYFIKNSFILVYPMQTGVVEEDVDLNNPSLMGPIEKIDELGKTLARLLKRK